MLLKGITEMKRIIRVVTLLTLFLSVALYTQASTHILVTEAITVIPCNGENTGAISINPMGGTAPYTYHWSNGSTIQNQSGLVAGTYSVTVKDNVGDTSIYSFTVTQPPAINITKTITDENCGGQQIGAVNLSVSGGTSPYSFSWSNGATTQNLANLFAQVYYVTVTDANGCLITDSANVTQPPGIGITMSITDVSCSSGNNNGAINVTVQFGNPVYQYNWNDGTTTQNRTGLTTGNYDLTVTDAIGCTATAAGMVSQLPGSLSINTSQVHPTCFNGTNGTINTTPVGSSGPYTYVWGDGPTTANRTGLAAGTYNVTATSSTGCTASASVILTQPAQISLTMHAFPLTCYDSDNGAITTTVSGGNSPYSYAWSNGDNASDALVLDSGSYRVTVTDNKGCTVSQTTLVSQPSQVDVTTTTTPVTCSGGPTGSVITHVAGGTSPYSYSWGGGIVSADRMNVPSGTYDVTVTDSHGCTGSVSANIAAYVPMTLISSQTNIVCYGNDDGTLNISVNNGVGPYSYIWSNADSTADIDSLVAGNYTVTVTDANSCTAAKTCTINGPPFPITVNSTVVDVSCFGLHTGSLSLNPINGAPPYNYKWGNGSTTATISNLAVGNYVVTITDSSGCKASNVYSVTQPALITPVTTVVNDSCFGNNTGSIDLSVTGGYSPFSYAWNDGVDSQTRVKLFAGNYDVTITDNHGCTATASATISQPTQLITVASPVNPSCFGGSNGTININASGGTAPYSFNWGGGITVQDRTGLSSGSYTVTVTDNMGCTSHASTTLTTPSAISITSTATSVACNGGNNGTIILNVSGGTAPYGFNWGGGVITQNRNNLMAGNYTVTVTDNAGCTAVNTTSVNEASSLSLSTVVTNATCFGLSNGAVVATATGGTNPYAYNWTNGNTTSHVNNLAAGNYTITVTDHVGCSSSLTAVVNEPALLSVSSTSTPATCFGSATGAIHILANGGTAPYSYNWGGGITTQNRTNVISGNYSVTVTDSAGCSVANTSSVSEPAVLVLASTQTNVSCHGGSDAIVQLSATGGTAPYSYRWPDGTTVANKTGLAPGNYIVSVTDANGCNATETITITQPTVLTLSSTATNVTCFGETNGAISLNVTGGAIGYTYTWSNGATSGNLTGIGAGNYSLTVTDSHACTATTSVVVTQPAQLSVTSNVTDASCFGGLNGGAIMHITGGLPAYNYHWSNGATTQNLSAVAAGTYQLSVSDANGCTISNSVSIAQPNQITLAASVSVVTCFGGNNGSILASASGGNGGFAYHWNNGATTGNITQLGAGNYSLTVDDAMNCSAVFTETVTQPLQINVTTSQTDVTCNGGNTGTADVSAVGGAGAYSYSWSGGQTTAQVGQLAEGNYYVTVSDANACSVSTAISITQINSLLLNVTTINELCFGQSTGGAQATVSGGAGGYVYHWSGGQTTATLSGIPSGVYDVTVTDANNCNTSASAIVSQPSAIMVTPSVTNVGCFGGAAGSIQTTTTGGTGLYQYSWSNGSSGQNINNVVAGNYSVTVKDANACSVSISNSITQPSQLQVALNGTDLSCNGGSTGAITIAVTGGTPGYFYDWSNGSTAANINNLGAGNYSVTVKDAQNCSVLSSVNITQPSALAVQTTAVNVSCNGNNDGSVNLQVSGGTGAYSYAWSNLATSQQISHLGAGVYGVTVKDANLCSAVASANITQPGVLSVTSSQTNYACAAKPGLIDLNVAGGTAPYTYLWQDGSNLQNRINLSAGSYQVTVTDQHHCSQSTSISVAAIPAMNVNLVTTNEHCFGDADGGISANVTGGTQPYNYRWSNASTASGISEVVANNYSVVISDANGCSVSSNTNVSQPPAITISPTVVPVTCFGMNNGSVHLLVTGGTPAYTYAWNNGSTNQNMAGLTAGNYHVIVTDAGNCTALNNIIVTQPAQMVISSNISNVGCSGQNDGSISLTTAGGTPPYLYNWSSSNEKTAVIDSLSSGSYAVTVNDNNGCTITSTFNILPSVPLVAISTAQNASCTGVNNGSVSVVVSGGTLPYNYVWSNGQSSSIATDLASGAYEVTVTDAKGCSVETGASIAASYELSVHASASSNVTNGGAIQLSATSTPDHGNAYSWGPVNYVSCGTCASTEAVPPQTTLFTVNVTDANGCKAVDTITVDVITGTTIFIPNVFTPNDDGVNDQFKIYGDLSNINYFDMVVFDRWGEKVYESNDPNFEWFGAYKGQPAPTGVYVYVASMVFNDGSRKEYKGSLTLLK